ncbi:S41 family peptidase [bacterium]|nr:S41 family peptidase [bacterium]
MISKTPGRSLCAIVLAIGGAALPLHAPARAQEARKGDDPPRVASPDPAPTKRETAATSRISVKSDPDDAVVLLFSRDEVKSAGTAGADTLGHGGKVEDRLERVLGRTPLDAVVPAGQAVIAIAKDGYILKVEPVELQDGATSRLEVRLSKDIAVPYGISFKDAPEITKTPAETDQLLGWILANVVQHFLEEKDPRALVDGTAKSVVAALSAVRERESLLRKELGDSTRLRFYRDEIDLRDYPELSLTETDQGGGKKRWELGAGKIAVEGVTDPADLRTYTRKLHEVLAFVRNKWDVGGKLKESMLSGPCIEALLGSLDDAHTHFLPPSAWKDMGDEATGTFGGIGVVVGVRDGKITVIAPMEGTPGEKAGLLAGDRIVAIDGRSTDTMTLTETVKVLRGPAGSKVELGVRRGTAAPFKVSLTRANIAIRYTKHQMLEDGGTKIGYLRITSFMYEKLDDEVEKALDSLEKDGMEALVVDLRNNPGGLLQEAARILDMFVQKDGVIVTTRGRSPLVDEKLKKIAASGGKKRPRYPIAVLVNEGSASASEILAGCLREHDLAVLVGERTFGKGSVQRVLPFEEYQCALVLTIATYHLPSGMTPHKKGIHPDVAVAITDDEKIKVAMRSVYSKTDEKDRQLETAIAELKKKLSK